MSKFLRLSLVALCLCASLCATVMGQSTTLGAIGGVVKDPQGAVVPGATITARNEETNKEETTTTDDEGRFRLANLQPGNYTVQINSTGFAPFSQQKIVVEVGLVTSIDVPLAITGSTEVVNVTSSAPVINTEQQDFSNNINQTSINELPINGRRASNFVLLTPGVAPDGNFGLISFRGISGLLNNSTVDGGDNNNAFFAEERGRTRISYVISQAAVREFQVNTSNYSAEYGRAAGGVINTVTKSGTNEFHGSGFYYLRDNKFGARNPFSVQSVLQNGVVTVVGLKPEDKRHQFGGTIGGPIVKDKAFFFFSYDQQKRDFPGVAAFGSPAFLNISAADRTTTRNNIRAAFPAGTTNAVLDAEIDEGLALLQSLTGEVPRNQDQLILLPKIDWNVNDKNTFTATYNRLRSDSVAGIQSPPVVTRGRASFGDDFVDVDMFTARLTSTISPTVLNEMRFQLGRENATAFGSTPTAAEVALANSAGLLASTGRLPQIDVASSSVGISFGNPNFLDRRAFPDERRVQVANTTTVNRGNHTFKFGGDINHTKDIVDNLRNESGAYSYSGLVTFLSDLINPAGKRYSNFNQAFGEPTVEFSTTDYNGFIQDDWRMSPRLTINLGLRYEFQRLPEPQIPNSLPNLPGQLVGPEQTRSFASDKTNFGPRFGFAADLTGDGKTSFRGGYGLYYGRIINSTISNGITNTDAPGAQINIFLLPADAGSPTFPNVIASPAGAARDLVVLSPGLSNPMIHQADLILEREIARNTAVSVSFLGSIGRRLPSFVDVNLNTPTQGRTFRVIGGEFDGQTFESPVFTGPRPDPRFGRITQVQSTVDSTYRALVLQANRRFTNGLQFQASYTFSKSTDTGQTSTTFTTGNAVLNSFDPAGEEGLSNFDIPHRFVASAVWTPDFFGDQGESKVGRAIFNGFTIAPIFQYSSGRPLTAFVSGNLSNTGIATTSPNRFTAGGILGSAGTARPFFLPRNTFRLPKTWAMDLRISRRFNFNEDMNIEFLAEGFNIFNRTNVTNVANRLYSVGGTNAAPTLTFDPTFLAPNEAGNTIYRERQIQFAVRFEF
ncbi:MAG TPA: carboxypeptidase regulatory-like domain-containing protein [Pyrinomonadaceae bacterium]|jgi:hypothetical protein